jgi:hypothetical protein
MPGLVFCILTRELGRLRVAQGEANPPPFDCPAWSARDLACVHECISFVIRCSLLLCGTDILVANTICFSCCSDAGHGLNRQREGAILYKSLTPRKFEPNQVSNALIEIITVLGTYCLPRFGRSGFGTPVWRVEENIDCRPKGDMPKGYCTSTRLRQTTM